MMSRKMKLLNFLALSGFVLGFAGAVLASGHDRVLMKAPHRDAAFVAYFDGIGNHSAQSFVRKYTLWEGLVIRQSYIKDGKIYIPPSGLYYTTRAPLAKVLQDDKVVILGKIYSLVDNGTRLDVLKNAEVKRGGSVEIGDGSKHLELSRISLDGNGFYSPRATFQILKPSGNYYGVAFPVATDPIIHNITGGILNDGTSKANVSYLPGEKGQNWHVEYYDSHVATSGQSYLVADRVSDQGAFVKEFATGAINWMLLTEKPAVEMLLGVNEEAEVANWTVRVEAIKEDKATVKLIDKANNKSFSKELGPVNDETTRYLPADEVSRNKMVFRPPTEDIQIQLDVTRGAFKDGKVSLVGYHDLIKIKNPDLWASDKRFITRPDT